MLSSCVKHKPDAAWPVMRDLDKLKSKLEIVMEKGMHDTCQHKYGLQSLQKSIRRDV